MSVRNSAARDETSPLPATRRSPPATNVALVVTLLITALIVLWSANRAPLSPRDAAIALTLFTLLFIVRVVGQIAVVLWQPSWLPRAEGENWNLVPYRILLPAQLLILILMAAIIAGVWRAEPPFGAPHQLAGRVLMGAGGLYSAIMAARYVVRMARRPEQRWFGGAIPIVFHMVLASFLLTWGRYLLAR